ncbi:hypothetical protein AWZ03_014448 [Drosophila navojoa]|uniref:Uncharacterized protein n=1 Tax=Drosophila navojoa TaxID=7232 RepID=A0A484AU47_DRONA|nr:hypothetical protein AWZ03_014448 [Drosophila navojoa]
MLKISLFIATILVGGLYFTNSSLSMLLISAFYLMVMGICASTIISMTVVYFPTLIMSEIVDTELLVNCTILAVRRFELNSIVNTTLLNSLNRTEVVSLLSGIIENRDNLGSISEAK